MNPYGFVGKYQAIAGAGKDPDTLAEEILGLLIKHRHAAARMASALVNRFADSPGYTPARDNLKLIQRIPKKAWTEELLQAIGEACKTNHELTADWGYGESTVAKKAKELVAKVRG